MKIIFIVGNSRSGTGMMSRILGNHPDIHTFLHEIHFFDGQWDPAREQSILPDIEATKLLSWLLCISTEGNLKHSSPTNYQQKATDILGNYAGTLTSMEIYNFFLQHIANKSQKPIICKQTPVYLLFASSIFKFFPDAFVLNMVRDPRDILLSQKNKWRVGYLATKNEIPFHETVRSWMNYHPFTISLLWKRNIETALKYKNNPRFISICYEDMVASPEKTMNKLCNAVGIKFQPAMLNIPARGSSTSKEGSNSNGVVDFRGKWKKGNLSNTEIFICERMLQPYMTIFNYPVSGVKPNILSIISLMILFFFKTPMAIILNIGRTKSIWDAIVRRFGKEN